MPFFGNIRAVTFDVGGTLIRPWPSVGHVYAEVASQHGWSNLEPEILNRQFAAAWRAKTNFNHSPQAWLELVKKSFAGLVDEGSVQQFFNGLYDRFSEPDAWRVFDDVHSTLQVLRGRRVKLGVISNWDERLRPLLKWLQLSPYFDVIIISIEVGFAKPAGEIFQNAVSALALPPKSILHIGDSLAEDVAGAQSAGLHALLLDRKARGDHAGCIPALALLPARL